MDSRAFYLKYRPAEISELDLVDVREGLFSIVKSGKVNHALLFSGPRGTGKTSAARIMAKAINCLESAEKHEPCNKCDICKEINAGSSLDLIEIDAASNRGIDDIRDLREKIKLSPVKCKYKVYIIDEVHMLTNEAFNALLKTLEEPPAHAVFVLCTTEPEKLPQTILSRCLRFNFRKAKPEEIVNSLKRVVAGEKLEPEAGVLEEISKFTDGSFRDAHKILEQLSLSGKKISLVKTRAILGRTEELSPRRLLSFLAAKDVKGALKEIERVVSLGANLNVYTEEIINCLRGALLGKIGLDVEEQEEINALSISEIKVLINLTLRASGEFRISPVPQLPLELVVVEYCGLKQIGENPKKQELQVKTKSGENSEAVGLGKVEEKWKEILERVKPLNHSVEALLKSCRPIKMEGQSLTVEVFYKFHKERLESQKCRQIVEEVVGEIFKTPIRLNCVLGKKPSKTEKADGKDGGGNGEEKKPEADFGDIISTAEEIFQTS